MSRALPLGVDIEACANRIEALQNADGSIQWVEAGVWDPWNHGESTMALAVAGRDSAVVKGLDALADRQETDGGWTGELGAGIPMDATGERIAPPKVPVTARDTNFTGYVALTVLRSALALDAPRLIARYAPMVTRALDWVVERQCPTGEIVWRDPDPDQSLEEVDALRAGNASLYKSLEAGLRLADALDKAQPHWAHARQRIAEAFSHRPERFDRKGTDRTNYAMDWYYPILTGAIGGAAAQARFDEGWSRFVVDDLGCRCVAHEPWVTTAETAELALTCLTLGHRERARDLITQLGPLAPDQDGYWMGWQYELGRVWPQEKPGWTAAAVVLAVDAYEGLTAGSDLLIRHAPSHAWTKPGAETPAYSPE